MKTNKGIIGIGLVLAIVLGVVVIGGGAYYLGNSNGKKEMINPVVNVEESLPVEEEEKTNTDSKVVSDCDSNSKPFIKVISPNGGEVYKAGDKITVKWSSCNIPATHRFSIALMYADGEFQGAPPSIDLSNSTLNDGIEIFDLKTNDSGLFTIFMKDNDLPNGSTNAWSNKFTINSITKNVSIENLKTYTNSKYKFNLDYPTNYLLKESNDGGFYNELNLFNLEINTPNDYQKDTDFNVGRVSIMVSPTISNCYYTQDSMYGNMTAVKIINGKEFRYNPKQPFEDSAMGGQRGLVSLFSLAENGQCYRIEKTIGYRDSRGFREPPYPPHFDEQKVNLDLDNIISTFKFN